MENKITETEKILKEVLKPIEEYEKEYPQWTLENKYNALFTKEKLSDYLKKAISLAFASKEKEKAEQFKNLKKIQQKRLYNKQFLRLSDINKIFTDKGEKEKGK